MTLSRTLSNAHFYGHAIFLQHFSKPIPFKLITPFEHPMFFPIYMIYALDHAHFPWICQWSISLSLVTFFDHFHWTFILKHPVITPMYFSNLIYRAWGYAHVLDHAHVDYALFSWLRHLTTPIDSLIPPNSGLHGQSLITLLNYTFNHAHFL